MSDAGRRARTIGTASERYVAGILRAEASGRIVCHGSPVEHWDLVAIDQGGTVRFIEVKAEQSGQENEHKNRPRLERPRDLVSLLTPAQAEFRVTCLLRRIIHEIVLVQWDYGSDGRRIYRVRDRLGPLPPSPSLSPPFPAVPLGYVQEV